MRTLIIILFLWVGQILHCQHVEFTIQKAHKSSVSSIDFIEGDKLLTTDTDSTTVLWDINTEKVFHVGKKGESSYNTLNNENSKFGIVKIEDNSIQLRNSQFHAEIINDFRLFMNTSQGKIVFWTKEQNGNKILVIEYSEKHNLFVLGLDNGEIIFLNAKNGRLIKRMTIHSDMITTMRIDKNQDLIATASNDRSFCLINLATKKLEKRLFGTSYHFKHLQFSEDGNKLLFSDETGKLSILNFSNNVPELTSYTKNTSNLMYFAPTQNGITGCTDNNKVITYDLENEKLNKSKWIKKQYPYTTMYRVKKSADFTLNTKYSRVTKGVFSSSRKYFAVLHHLHYPKEDDYFWRISLINAETHHVTNIKAGYSAFDFYKDHLIYLNYDYKFAEAENKNLDKLTLPSGIMEKFAVLNDSIILYLKDYEFFSYNPESQKTSKVTCESIPKGKISFKHNLFFAQEDDALKIYTFQNDSLRLINTINEDAIQFDIHKNQNTIAIITENGLIKFYRLDKIDQPVSFATSFYDDFAFFDKDQHYFIPKSKLEFIGINYNNNYVFPYQFDKYFNRPDIVLGKTGLISESFEQLLAKSISKRTLTTENLTLPNFEDIPVVSILEKIENQDSISLKLRIKSTNKEGKIICKINDVASFQQEVTVEDSEISIQVPKVSGVNKYEVSFATNDNIESVKQFFEFESQLNNSKPNLYVVSIGVSQYEQKEFNLVYANKDANDFDQCIKEQSKNKYENIYSLVITDKDATRSNIQTGIKDFLAKSSINDVVILFMAGHGLLDKDLNYYFGNSDIDFLSPETNGISFDEIEQMLTSINSNKKLLIMDTCHSGEVDKEETTEDDELLSQDNSDIVFRKGTKQYKTTSKQTTLELSKSIFFDMNNTSGANVIASASGNEFAMETNEFENGIFTYALMQSLTDKKADTNKDGQLWLDEIRNYTYNQVVIISDGKQHPTVRSENLLTNFRIK